MKNPIKYLIIFLILSIGFINPGDSVSASILYDEQPVARSVLFYSTSCGHCQKLITQDLPPIMDEYGDQLLIIGINVSSVEGQELFQSFIEGWDVPDDEIVVPILVISDIYLVGGGQIPAMLPEIVEKGLGDGGIDWPDIPGLDEILEQIESQSTEQGDNITPTAEEQQMPEETNTQPLENTPTLEHTNPIPTGLPEKEQQEVETRETEINNSTTSIALPFEQELTLADRFKRDLVGNTVAVIVLIGLLISVVVVVYMILSDTQISDVDWSSTIPVLSIIGLGVAGYLTWIEVTSTEAVCGPIGDCNTVQDSPYAMLFGFLPVGVLGFIGYIAILAGWLLARFGPEKWQNTINLMIWGMALFGVIFSIYLTYLEPFVIGATCMWCISSAVIITLQLWASTRSVRLIWSESEGDYSDELD